ncbi:MAG: tyrosine-type recombinase/integrase [Bacteroidales bacterium]|nr:tyrosine-type recombinase/integrase [Bacteroidales bacterium]
MELKRYSKSTIDNYRSHLNMLKLHFKNKNLKSISDHELFEFIYYLVKIKNISASYQRQIVGGFKLFYKEIYKRDIPFEYLKVERHESKLPIVLSKNEVNRIVNSIKNIKHKALISLLYSSGLRIGELLNLKKTDIDSERMVVHVKDAKGKKDRYTILSNRILELLRNYYTEYRPKDYLFEGQKGGKYSSESAGQLFKRALKRANIKKSATLHTLRHSFATHLLEDGIGIPHIQKLLGHSNIKTTLIYTHIAQDSLLNIKSPFDD